MNLKKESQPILPQISMRWYFVAASVTAALTVWAMSVESGQTLVVVLALLAMAGGIFLLLSALFFLVAYSVGAMHKILAHADQKTQSPFAHETMPPQIIPPQASE